MVRITDLSKRIFVFCFVNTEMWSLKTILKMTKARFNYCCRQVQIDIGPAKIDFTALPTNISLVVIEPFEPAHGILARKA